MATESSIRPVLIGDRCVGHLIHTCRGWRAFDTDDYPVGIFQKAQDAAVALTRATASLMLRQLQRPEDPPDDEYYPDEES